MFILGFLYLSPYTYCSGKDTLISVSRLLRAHDFLSFPLVNMFCHFLSRTIFCFSFPLECQRMFHRHQPPRTVRAPLFFIYLVPQTIVFFLSILLFLSLFYVASSQCLIPCCSSCLVCFTRSMTSSPPSWWSHADD